MSQKPVTSIDVTYNVSLITLDNLPNDIKLISEIFTSIANEGISIDMVSKSPSVKGNTTISFSLLYDDLVKAMSSLNKFNEHVHNLSIEIDSFNTKFCIFGKNMKDIPGVAARLFTVLASEGIEVKLVTTSESDISCLIDEKDADKACESVKKEFSLEE
ncbi:ACT domain-containing protein [Acetivibrio cellulolyticus]|uniref:ACT domain-containing protein n=1 Tax=Acetivibrio cellulolyticus TaxID=35830 RepID=UPI0001E3054E|nr:ACT domain-containing protein [Acetivibrio cellulolyticus]